FNSGTLTVTASTLSGNAATFRTIFSGSQGGAIFNTGTVNLTDCTLSGNSADTGGGIFSSGTKVTATSSLFANPAGEFGPGGNLAAAASVSLGHNLFSDAPAVHLDPTDLINADPLLGPLADNGGPTMTQALLPGSPAIDAGVAVPGVTTDQRGIPRTQ